MSDLFDKSIRTLELPRVLELLSEQAVSAEARQRALRLRPETEPEEVLRLLEQYHVTYIFVGSKEKEKYGDALNELLLQSIGDIVYQDTASGTYILQVQDT